METYIFVTVEKPMTGACGVYLPDAPTLLHRVPMRMLLQRWYRYALFGASYSPNRFLTHFNCKVKCSV